ncbi:hypothetical protein BDY24DRAFT_192307 [Mrakia frigida]|uniref:DUF1769 domain-containing protein n=1 Tax=Mrakia frigida TaxID=29902 RepID=UPI003FCC131E
MFSAISSYIFAVEGEPDAATSSTSSSLPTPLNSSSSPSTTTEQEPTPTPAPMVKSKRLRVTIGGNRVDVEIANVNDPARPTEIDTDKFVGRVLVRIRDFDGITSDGAPPNQGTEYFAGRSRRFAIQIEGRFKEREGAAPYDADEIQFGSDFDHLVDFPRTAFNAGMKVATWVDPATFYEETPPSGRPYIMSPYAACMNTLAAWPAPSRAKDAVVIHAGARKQKEPEVEAGSEDVVPVEKLGGKHHSSRHLIRYWRFLGFKTDPQLQSFLTNEAPHILVEAPSSPTRPGLVHSASLGVIPRTNSPDSLSQSLGTSTPTSSTGPSFASGSPASSRPSTPKPEKRATPEKKASGSSFGFGSMLNALGGGPAPVIPIRPEDVTTADHLRAPEPSTKVGVSTKLDEQLGAWRFADPGLDPVEDNSFVFIEKSVPTPQRRKHFVNVKNRKDFKFHPDVVYATSFFTTFANLNTFDLSIGPVNMSLVPYFHDMPIRYSLRSTRLEEFEGKMEEEVFATIAFQLVDVAQ